MKKEMKKVGVIVKEKDDLIDITKRDISEANSEIFRLKREISDLVKELSEIKGSRVKNLEAENDALKKANLKLKLAVSTVEREKAIAKKVIEE